VNLTISVDDELLERARELARGRDISLQELLREQLRTLAGARSGAEVADELLELMREHGGRSGGGRAWRREDAYADRV
jgi:predicted transcriptional regulator